MREVLISCPRASTRAAFACLATDAVARADRNGDQMASISRVLLALLDEDSLGSARWMSPGGLTHLAQIVSAVAAATAAAAASAGGAGGAGGAKLSVLNTDGAISRLLSCIQARHVHETNSQPRVSQPPSSAAASSSSSSLSPLPVHRLQDVGGFPAIVNAIARLLAAASATGGGGIGQALGADGAAAVTDKQFMVAALQACPREAGDLITNLVWRGWDYVRGSRSRVVGVSTVVEHVKNDEAAPGVPGAADLAAPSPAPGSAGDDYGATQETEQAAVAVAATVVEPSDNSDSIPRGEVSAQALTSLLEIVLDTRRKVTIGAAGAAVSATKSSGPAAAELSVGMGVLARVLHLRGDGEVKSRLEAALDKLAMSARPGVEEGISASAGCGGGLYLTGKLVASLFIHVPEARPMLARSPWLLLPSMP